jgi:hypothetical protein
MDGRPFDAIRHYPLLPVIILTARLHPDAITATNRGVFSF